eukprot:1149242-Pelagomonas_calceolata.AAC.2
MTSALRHAIYSAILNTEATATFMFLPASSKLMIINPYSKLLTACPHLCCKHGIIPKGRLTYDNSQSWPSQEIALPQHTWDLQLLQSLDGPEYSYKSPLAQPEPYLAPRFSQGYSRSQVVR